MRETGYYWVNVYGQWLIAEYNQARHAWFISGEDRAFNESYFEKIDEHRILHETPQKEEKAS